MVSADRFEGIAWLFAAGIVLPLALMPFDARVVGRLAGRLTDRLPAGSDAWSDFELDKWLASATGLAGFVWAAVRFKAPAVLCIASLGSFLIEHALSPTEYDVVWESEAVAFVRHILFVSSWTWPISSDRWVKRVAVVRFQAPQPSGRLGSYLSSAGDRDERRLLVIAAACFVVAAMSGDYVALGDDGMLSKRWYQLRSQVIPLDDFQLACIGNIAGTYERAIAVRFRDGSYWTSIAVGNRPVRGSAREAAMFLAAKDVPVMEAATVWPDESAEANQRRRKLGMPASPCAATES